MIFYKMQGWGNDFIMIPEYDSSVDYSKLAKKLCERRVSIGADGLIVIKRNAKNEKNELFMGFYNADGSIGKMCGNGLRCFLYLSYKLGLCKKEGITVDTLAGKMYGKIVSDEGLNAMVDENLGFPVTSCKELEMNTSEDTWFDKDVIVDGRKVTVTCFQLGALHLVTFNKKFSDEDAYKLHSLPLFKDRINVNFAEVINRKEIVLHTYERGVGWTLACGTGSASSAYCAYKKGLVDNEVTVHEELGDLKIEIKDDGIHVIGPAVIVCKGKTEDLF